MHFITSSIPFTHPLNTPNTIQTPSSLVDSLLDSYVMSLISVGFKSCLFFTSQLSMKLVIFGLMLHMFGSYIRIYGSYFKSIYHSYLPIHQSYPVAQPFSTIALYTHRDNTPLAFSPPYDNTFDISESLHHHFRTGKVLQQFERKIRGPFHHFATTQGIDCI